MQTLPAWPTLAARAARSIKKLSGFYLTSWSGSGGLGCNGSIGLYCFTISVTMSGKTIRRDFAIH